MEKQKGALFALGAYTAWGLFPLYWKLLRAFSPFEILSQRVVWSFVFYVSLLYAKRQVHVVRSIWQMRSVRWMVFATSLLIGCNWILFIWAVNTGHVLETSLGYFINPLFNVVLGKVFFKERLNPLRWLAVAIAAFGVLLLSVQSAHFPWIALTLAATFSLYGLCRKRLPYESLATSTVETSFLVLPSIALALSFRFSDQPVAMSTFDKGLFLATGFMTGLPLLWFSEAAQRLPLSTLGFFQYISPTLQMLLAITVYEESLSRAHAQAFVCIWIALSLYSFDAFWAKKNRCNYG